MCDYSLENYASRKAVAGEDLVLTRFASNSIGFTSADNDTCVVCCEPGMTMTLHFDVFPMDVTFAQKAKAPSAWGGFLVEHHDGVTMPYGEFRLLQHFAAGLRATVIKPLPDVLTQAVAHPESFEDIEHRHNVEAPVPEIVSV
jgi:hypothetical protein